MNKIINILAGILFLVNTSIANEINYKLNLTNITFTSDKSLEFDIYLMSAGETKEEFRYALGQYFVDVNPKFANEGTLTYSIVSTELPESMKPGSISVSGNQLRMSVNQINSDNSSYPVIPSSKPGLLIARMKLETSADKFSKEEFDLKWSSDENNFKTKIVAFKNDRLAEVTDINNHNIESDNNGDTEVENATELPTEFSLSQNYPNPFNPSTVIRYSLSENSFVTLKVYDVIGNEIATLVNEKQNSGTYNYQFSTVNYQLSSGVYFYKITAGSFSAVKRMFLIK